jgi:hypothetical protein
MPIYYTSILRFPLVRFNFNIVNYTFFIFLLLALIQAIINLYSCSYILIKFIRVIKLIKLIFNLFLKSIIEISYKGFFILYKFRSNLLELCSVVRGRASLLKFLQFLSSSLFFINYPECSFYSAFKALKASKDINSFRVLVLYFFFKVISYNRFKLYKRRV